MKQSVRLLGHVPGPWQYQRGSLTIFTCSEGTVGITQAIASTLDGNGDFNRSTQEANARLMAAAPELLEALTWALAELRGETKYDVDVADEQTDNCYRLADAAHTRALRGD